MIDRDSILRRLPANLDRRQVLFLDGIRHAAEIASFAHRRLQATLTQLAVGEHEGAKADNLYTSAFLDAWSLVDVIDRFRTLWKLLPYSTPAAPLPGTKSFAEITQSIRDLRNVSDHLGQRADYVVAQKGTALGVLSWFTALRPDGLEGVICTLVPGTLQSGSAHAVNPAGRMIELPTGLIHLAAGEHKACLSEALPEMAVRVADLEAALQRGINDLDAKPSQAGADLLVKMNVSFVATNNEQSSGADEP